MRQETQEQQPKTLEQLLDRIAGAASDHGRVSLGAVLDAVGRRSFAPLLLLAGLITLAPIVGDIPGVPTLMGLLVLLTGGQLLFGRDHFWLPNWMLARSLDQQKLCKAVGWMRRPARFVDRLTRPRLTVLTDDGGHYLVAGACIAIAMAMPPMEFVPFSANGAGAALTAFGLALLARDGVIALIALTITVLTFAAVAYGLL